MFFKRIKKFIACLMLLGFFCSNTVAEDTLQPFSSDGCSSFPNGTFEYQELWLTCCTAHDLAYWQGGTYLQRVQADEELQSCVESVGEPAIAALMLAGVRVGGTPYLPTPYRWGYGWPFPRGYKALSANEKKQVEKLFPKTDS